MEEFIPVFEEQENNVLVQIDNFEDSIKEIQKLTKQYDKLKKDIKEQMVKIGRENELSQVKWTTPKGIQITCSIGKPGETGMEERLNVTKLMNEYPEAYRNCLETKEVVTKTATSDRLVITLPKEEK